MSGSRRSTNAAGRTQNVEGLVMKPLYRALDIALWNRSEHFHRVAASDLNEFALVDFPSLDRVAEIIEVADHGSREVEVQLAARDRAHLEAVAYATWDEDERSSGTRDLAILQEHHVLAVENVERLVGVVVEVHGRSEIGGLLGLENGNNAARLFSRRLHGHGERGGFNGSSLAGTQCVRLASHAARLPGCATDRSASSLSKCARGTTR